MPDTPSRRASSFSTSSALSPFCASSTRAVEPQIGNFVYQMLLVCILGCQQNLAGFLDHFLQDGIVTLAEQLGDVRRLGRRMLARLQRLGQSLQNIVAHFL